MRWTFESVEGALWFPLWGETCYWLKAAVSLKGGRERMVVCLGWEGLVVEQNGRCRNVSKEDFLINNTSPFPPIHRGSCAGEAFGPHRKQRLRNCMGKHRTTSLA